MSFVIQGPYPNMRTTLLLPSPEEGNTDNLQSSVQILRSMNGKVYTYIKPKRGRQRYRWDFVASKDKGLEAKDFVKQYAGDLVQIVDHNEVLRIGWLTINPFETLGEGRANPWGERKEAVGFSIEFEERV